ncbi:MAG: inorganic phosphate transporter [Nitrososphaerales archaeon]
MNSLLVSANNISLCCSMVVGSRIIRKKLAIFLTFLSFSSGLLLEGFKLFTIKELVNKDLSEKEVLLILFLVMISFLIAQIIKTPLSLSKGIVISLLGLALAKGFEINLFYTLNILLIWVLFPILSFLFTIIALKMDRKLSYKRVWIKIATLKPLLLFSSFLTAYVIGSNTLSLLVALSDDKTLAQYLVLLGSFIGSFFFSGRILRFLGEEIFGIRYVSAFSSQTMGALMVELATQLHIPVAVSENVTSSIMGSMLSYKTRVISLKKVLKLFLGWFLTPLITLTLAFLLAMMI